METAVTTPSRQTKTIVWLTLLLITAIAWVVIFQQTQMIGSMNEGMATMEAGPVSLLLFLPLWVVMMVAMMFPAVAPVVSLFATISSKRRAAQQPAAPTWIFLIGYLFVWSLFGIGAYLLAFVVPTVGMMAAGLRMDSPVAAGIVLIVAGLYQLSPLKQVCLRHCRSPLSIILHGWHDGYSGAFRMGFKHGAYCLGCCWGLMLVLFVVGLMNLLWMVLLTIAIFVEKVFSRGLLISRLLALALVLFGIVTLVMPWFGQPMMN